MNIFEGKRNTDAPYPVRLVDATDLVSEEATITYGSIGVYIRYQGLGPGWVNVIIGSGDWQEVANGDYWLKIGADEFTNEGLYLVRVASAGCADYRFVVDVRDKTVAEMMDEVHLIKAAMVNRAVYDVDANQKRVYDDDEETVLATLNIESISGGVQESPA